MRHPGRIWTKILKKKSEFSENPCILLPEHASNRKSQT